MLPGNLVMRTISALLLWTVRTITCFSLCSTKWRWLVCRQPILRPPSGKPRNSFVYIDRGQMATIGRNRAIVEFGKLRFSGLFAWFAWLVVHIYFLVGFKNRLFVVLSWAWSYLTFRRGARLIVEREWQLGKNSEQSTFPRESSKGRTEI